MVRRCSLLFIINCIIICSIHAQSSFQNYLNKWANDTELKHASVSFCAIDIHSNTLYAHHDKDRSLIPASSLKVITTSTSLALLGKDYRFKTTLGYSGSIENNTLNGHLHIIGGADPSLGSPYMEDVPSLDSLLNLFVFQLKKQKINEIQGDLLIDESFFHSQSIPMDWQRGDLGNHYGAASFGFNIHDNLYALYFKQNQFIGKKPTIKNVQPEVPYLNFDNEVKNGHKYSGDNAYIYCAPKSLQAVIRGTIPVGSNIFKIKGAIPDPAQFFGIHLQKKLKRSNIHHKGEIRVISQPSDMSTLTKLYNHFSPPLSEICKHINLESRNMYCEVLVRLLAKRIHNDPSTEVGVQSVVDFWKDRGVDPNGFFMRDGSGLSARNGISSYTFANILRKIHVDKKSFGDFYDYLAIGGVSGTLSYFGKNTILENNLRAKSGSLNRVRSYSGYITTADKRFISFSLIVNNYTCKGSAMRKKMEKLLVALAESKI